MTGPDRVRAALGRSSTRDADHDRPCPWCRAATGQPCTSRARGRRMTTTHPARQEAAA